MDWYLQKAYLYALGAVLMWSSVATAFKLTLANTSFIAMLCISSLFSLLLLFFIILYNKKLTLLKIYLKSSYKRVLLLGFINPFAYYLVLFKAYELLPAQEAQAINYTWALMLAYLSVVFLNQTLLRSDIIAGLFCYFGVLIIATKGNLFSLQFESLEGLILAVLSTFLWSVYWIFNTKSKSDVEITLFGNTLVGAILVLILFIFTKEYNSLSFKGVLGSLYIGALEMGVAFLLWQKALNQATNTSKIANLIFLSPPISLIFISTVLKEKILFSTLIALIFIFAGLFIQQRRVFG
jgi:drug/metabolite transporter (DMT)-like permease